MAVTGTLNPAQLQLFDTNGYLVVESFASNEEIDATRKRMDQLLEEFDISTACSIFTTRNQMTFFFEEKAFDDNGNLKQPKQLSINKVGHALLDLEPVFKKISCSEKMAGVLSSFGYKKPVIIQSKYIFKQPGIGCEVVPHQDNSFLYTEPCTCTGMWLALEDATIVNCCLWAIPGSSLPSMI